MPDLATAVLTWTMTPGLGEEFPSLEGLLHRPAWMAEGACRGEDPALFFPARGASTSMAKAVCAGCPVRVQCLDYAAVHPTAEGVWGGTSHRQRKRLRSLASGRETGRQGRR